MADIDQLLKVSYILQWETEIRSGTERLLLPNTTVPTGPCPMVYWQQFVTFFV